MTDFTIKTYRTLLETLIWQSYNFQTFEQHLLEAKRKSIVLRHDVDLLPHNSLTFAKIQAEFGIKGSYYFRAVPESWDVDCIHQIADLGHEVGYHYECLTTCKGNMERGIRDFVKNLEALRSLVPVATICMHGSPLSKYDSKDLWNTYDYKDYDILGEPYFDVDYNSTFYLTDTGRKWDGHATSVRDKVQTRFTERFHTTHDIIRALEAGLFPENAMFTFHPQRWHNNPIGWGKELVLQNIKNVVKQHFFVKA